MRWMLVVATAAVVPLCLQTPSAAASQEALRLDFQQLRTPSAGSEVLDASGSGHHATVRTSAGGALRLVSGPSSSQAVDFPRPCAASPCPKAVIGVPDGPGLDPGRRPFSFGLSVRLHPWQTSDGSNLIQKGLWGQRGGQWKLQIDGRHGRPSCVVSGTADGQRRRVVVRSTVSVSNGAWHDVACRRTASAVEISVDGTTTGRAAMPAVDLDSEAGVVIGGKNEHGTNNDQYFGHVDDVFVRLD